MVESAGFPLVCKEDVGQRSDFPKHRVRYFMSMLKEWVEACSKLDEAGKNELVEAFEALEISDFGEDISSSEASANMAMQDIQGDTEQEKAFCAIICPKYFKVSAWDTK